MKLHYFNQVEPDSDDQALFDARREGFVPPGCLLGGNVITMKLMPASTNAGMTPCKTCNGPRERCGGEPLLKDLDLERSAEREHLRKLFLGEGDGVVNNVLAQLLKVR